MGFLWKICTVVFVLSSLLQFNSAVAQSNRKQNEKTARDTALDHFKLDGISYEKAVRLGFSLGPLIRGKSDSQKLNTSQTINKSFEDDQFSNQNDE